jgi:hypothetical protein
MAIELKYEVTLNISNDNAYITYINKGRKCQSSYIVKLVNLENNGWAIRTNKSVYTFKKDKMNIKFESLSDVIYPDKIFHSSNLDLEKKKVSYPTMYKSTMRLSDIGLNKTPVIKFYQCIDFFQFSVSTSNNAYITLAPNFCE